MCLVAVAQVRTRKTADGLSSVSLAEKRSSGRVYVRSLLIELGMPDDFDGWIRDLVRAGRVEVGGMYNGVDTVFARLKWKVENRSDWHLPESRYGSVVRPVAKTHAKGITMALRASTPSPAASAAVGSNRRSV